MTEHMDYSRMAAYIEMQFKHSLKKPEKDRSPEDLDIIYAFLHGMEALSCLREPALRGICRSVRFEYHDANDILYCFGKRTAGCARRPNECLILEPSEMIVIDYPDVQLMKPGVRISNASGVSIDRLLGMDQQAHADNTYHNHHQRSRYLSDASSDSLAPELQNVQTVLQRSEHFLRSDSLQKRSSRASDTSSAYSGSDVMQSEDGDMAGLQESNVDTDDDDDDEEEEGYDEQTESLIVRDTVRECLEKEPSERTEDDIEVLLEFMQHLPAFANMTLATRRALCAVMVFAVVQREGTIVMNDGEELDSWSVILNGHVEITRPDGTKEHLHMGDSFGITPTMEKMYHKGVMRTKVDDCQFVCIAQAEYYAILHQGEENTQRVTEQGEVVLVKEHRVLDGGSRTGAIVIRGTPEKLMRHLVEEHSSVDPTYVEDFLLTYRTFLRIPTHVAEKLLTWFKDVSLRDKVTRVVLLWVNNHFNDFETEPKMNDFLEKFEHYLERERMGGQLRLLNIACAAKARERTITLLRATREEILHFSVLGGQERGCGIFITKVEKGSKAHEAGLKRGDQILEVNNQSFEHISHHRALDILRGTTHLSITVKSNLLAFKEMLLTQDRSPGSRQSKQSQIASLQTDPKQRLSSPHIDSMCVKPVINSPSKDKLKDERKDKSQTMSSGHKKRIRKALMKFNIVPRNVNSDSQLGSMDDSTSTKSSKKSSTSSSTASSPLHTPHLSASNPDLTSLSQYEDTRSDFPEHVLKVYRADQTCKYFLVHKETTAHEVVMLALKEFGITEPSSNYSLCEVTVENQNFIKQKRLPDQLSNLPDRSALNGRYYLKNNMSTDTLVPDEMTGDLIRESLISFLQLNSAELAAQLTLRDFQFFKDIEPTEYIDDLFELESKYGMPHLSKFSELSNKEMFWVVTEVCSELNAIKRMKIIKQFIKIARHCKECKNFNSMFAIISGLGHGSVSRLRQTWDKLPSKYTKLFSDLQDLMDPSRNMSKYRNLISSEMVHPPLIPFFPVVKKDLTFIHLGNDSKVDGLINFEKLRMIAKEIRHVTNMTSAQYDMGSMYASYGTSQSVFSAFASSANASAVATMRRQRRKSILPNPRKMYEEAQMVRRVRAYLKSMEICEDETRLSEMSSQCEPPAGVGARKRDPSPSPAINLAPKFEIKRRESKGDKTPVTPKKILGAESPEAVRKLMALSDKVQPHNRKRHPLPGQRGLPHSPNSSKRPISPRHRKAPPVAVNLSAESSSVISLSSISHRKSASTASSGAGSNESNSPTNSVGSASLPSCNSHSYTDTDSGHNSVTSTNFDSHSQCSIGSCANSPPINTKHAAPSLVVSIGEETVPGHQVIGSGHASPIEGHGHQPPPTANGHPPSLGPPPAYNPSPSPSPTPSSASSSSSGRPPLPPYHVMVQNNPAYSQYIQQQYHMLKHQRPPLPDYHSATQMANLARRKQQYNAYHGRSHSYDGMSSSPQRQLQRTGSTNSSKYYMDSHDDTLVDDADLTYEIDDNELDDEEEEIVSAV